MGEGCVWIAKTWVDYFPNRGKPKNRSSNGCGGKFVPKMVVRGYASDEPEDYRGNVGLGAIAKNQRIIWKILGEGIGPTGEGRV